MTPTQCVVNYRVYFRYFLAKLIDREEFREVDDWKVLWTLDFGIFIGL